MRGEQDSQIELLTTTSPGKRVPATHPIREIKRLADQALAKLDSTFDAMYSSIGRPSIPPERLLKAQLLIGLYSVRSERQFCERLDYDLLFRFFLDMNLDDPSWDASVFTKNRDRLVQHEVARQFFEEVVRQARQAGLVSAEHFTVDGTLIEAWASLKSFRKKGEKPEDRPPPDDRGNPTVNFHGEKRSNETHESTTDPEARLARKGNGKETELGPMEIEVPRDRDGSFDPQLVKKRQTRFTGFDEKILGMYARGMTVRDIQGHLEELYGVDVSPDLISRVTSAVAEDVVAWQRASCRLMSIAPFPSPRRPPRTSTSTTANRRARCCWCPEARPPATLWVAPDSSIRFAPDEAPAIVRTPAQGGDRCSRG